MGTFSEIQNHLHFLNTGPSRIPGLVVGQLDANIGHYGRFKHLLVVCNATTTQQTFASSELTGLKLKLHPI